jgi:hypothetical protein
VQGHLAAVLSLRVAGEGEGEGSAVRLERADEESRASFAGALRRLRFERAARRLQGES